LPGVRLTEWLDLGFSMMADSLYSVATGIKKKGAEVVLMVVSAKAGRTVVGASVC
jgi:hypothetical protein